MARDALTAIPLPQGTDLNNLTGVFAGISIAPAKGVVLWYIFENPTAIRVANTALTDQTVTFKAGTNPPAVRRGLGDLTMTVPASGAIILFLATARHFTKEGQINVDFSGGFTGKIAALRLTPSKTYEG